MCIVMDGHNLDEIHANHSNKVWCILHLTFRNEILSWMIENWMKNHLVSDDNHNIVNL